MGVIEIIGVNPDHQRRGIGSWLTEHRPNTCSLWHGHRVVETGGDPGHGPARATYETAGFALLPIARYFRMLG